MMTELQGIQGPLANNRKLSLFGTGKEKTCAYKAKTIIP
jgi:hypothetical protein